MTVLSKHIEALLTRHNCVVVPKLGGFVTQYVSAFYDAESGCYYPPSRSVSFNSMLAINDGLLIERYIVQENLTYADASRLLASHVDRLKEIISEEGSVEISGVGVLTSNGENGYSFEPCDGGLMTPEYYALDAAPVSLAPVEEHVDDNNEDDNEKNYVIRLNRNFVNYVAAAVISVMFYFLMAPVGFTPAENMEVASMIPPVVVHHTTTIQRKAELNTINKEYVLVIASAVAQESGERLVEKLKADGQESARLYKDSMLRVVIGHFASDKEARDFRKSISHQEVYSNCWVMEVDV